MLRFPPLGVVLEGMRNRQGRNRQDLSKKKGKSQRRKNEMRLKRDQKYRS
jgi:hypothetical protein